MVNGFVVTGGARGIGRATVERLLADGFAVAVIDVDEAAFGWAADHPSRARLRIVAGDAADEEVAAHAVDAVGEMGTFAGWVNNAAVFRDASLDSAPMSLVADIISANLRSAIVGCGTAVRALLAAGRPGSIVNLSSHQARQAVRGCLPYVTAKAGIEGMTRALAVEYGPRGIRVNAVAPGSVWTERYGDYLAAQSPSARAAIEADMARLHPLGRVARASEVAAAIAWLLSGESSFVNGATIPVDGGRTVMAVDPEAHADPAT